MSETNTPVTTAGRDPAIAAVLAANNAKDLIKHHGPAGSLIRTLQRYSLAGWIVAGIVAAAYFLTVLVFIARDVPVLAVDESGRVLGQFEYLSPESRTDNEIIGGAQYWLEHYLSANSTSIYADFATALTMMDQGLSKKKLDEAKQTGYIDELAAANTRSKLKFDEEKTELIERKGLEASVKLVGTRTIEFLEPDEKGRRRPDIEEPFEIETKLKIVPRKRGVLGTLGLQVIGYTE